MKKIFASILGFSFVASLVGASFLYYNLERFEQTYDGDLIEFSLTDMYYDTVQQLELSAVSELRAITKIYYTTDGSEPTQDSIEYTQPISLGVIEERGCHIIRAALFQDGVSSDKVYTKSYFIGTQAALHEDTYIVSLAGDPDSLYGELGIFSGPVTLPSMTEEEQDAANYLKHGKEWERPVNVQIFDTHGETVISQDAGIRISGHYSRYAFIKSLKLYARREYDPSHGMFEADFLTQGETAGGSGLPIEKVNRIELRNGGNDFVATMLGDAYSRRLAQACDIPIVGQTTPAAVYINGTFYGFMWMQPNDDEKTVAEFAGISDSDNVKIVDGSEELVTGTDNEILDEYYRLKEYLYILDYGNQGARDAIEELIDIDNLFMYYAFQMHVGNTDWPTKNFKAWKYTGMPNPDNPNTDGRWRFLLYDIDYTFGSFQEDHSFGLDSFEWIFEAERSKILLCLLQGEDYRNRFINIWCDLMNTLASERATELLEYTIAQSQDELLWREETYPETRTKEEITWEDGQYPTRFRTQDRLDGYERARTFMQNRATYVHENLQNYLDVNQPFELEMQVPDGAMVSANGSAVFEPGDSINSTYYADCAPYFEAVPADGYRVVGWDVNGERYYEAVLAIDTDMLAGAEKVVAAPVMERVAEAQPVMRAISYYGNEDWVEIYNPGTSAISLAGYYLSDKSDNTKKYKLPAVELKPGESMIFYGSDNIYAPLGAYQFDFNLSQYETITLTDPGGASEALKLPNSKNGYIYERDIFGRWKYVGG